MDTILKWASQYSVPVLVLICVGAAFVYVLKLITERTIETQFNKHTKELELKLERHSEFEQQVFLDRYKLVCEFSQRLSRITTDLNRAAQGITVEGLFNGAEFVALTTVFEDLAAKRFQLSDKFHQFFYHQAQVVLSLSNSKTAEQRKELEEKYLQNLDQLTKMANDEFGTDKISW
jgi:hypothetical protein